MKYVAQHTTIPVPEILGCRGGLDQHRSGLQGRSSEHPWNGFMRNNNTVTMDPSRSSTCHQRSAAHKNQCIRILLGCRTRYGRAGHDLAQRIYSRIYSLYDSTFRQPLDIKFIRVASVNGNHFPHPLVCLVPSSP
jgi:hypothetical protein